LRVPELFIQLRQTGAERPDVAKNNPIGASDLASKTDELTGVLVELPDFHEHRLKGCVGCRVLPKRSPVVRDLAHLTETGIEIQLVGMNDALGFAPRAFARGETLRQVLVHRRMGRVDQVEWQRSPAVNGSALARCF